MGEKMTIINFNNKHIYKELLPEHFELYRNIHNELYSDLDRFKEEHKDLNYMAELEKEIDEVKAVRLCKAFELAYVRVVGWKFMFITWKDVHDKIMDLLEERYGISIFYPQRTVLKIEEGFEGDIKEFSFKELDTEGWDIGLDELD